MKHIDLRRPAALLLALVLSLSLAVPAAADEDGTGGGTLLTAADLSTLSVDLGGSAERIIDAVSIDLTASVSGVPENVYPEYTYEWSSSNTDTAEVSGTGSTVSVLRGSTPGRSTITVKVTARVPGVEGVSADAERTLTVSRGVLVPGVTLNKTSATTKPRQSVQLSATPYVPAGSDDTVTWRSDNETSATVSSSGLVTGQAPGTAYITATVGAYSAQCLVTVEELLARDITASASVDAPMLFSGVAGEMADECKRVLGTTLRYVTGLSVSTSQGTLYYGYNSEAEPGAGVGASENYYYFSGDAGRLLSDVAFVPRAGYSGDVTIGYTGYDTNGNAFQGDIIVSVSYTSGISYSTTGRDRIDFNPEDFAAVCRSRTGHELQSITFSLPSASKGTLFYKYSGSDLDNKVLADTAYYCSKSPQLADVSFVAADGYSGSLTVSYTGRDVNGNTFGGSVSIEVSTGASGRGSISYSTTRNRGVRFEVDDFDRLCRDMLDVRLKYVTFTPPSSSVGQLRYNYNSSSSSGGTVFNGSSYYRTSYPYLDNVYFVPASDWTGTADISFTGYGTNSQRFTGTVSVEVTSSSSSSGRLNYTTRQDTAVRFNVDDFSNYCSDQTDERLSYVRFDLPSSSVGRLRYNYYSSSSSGSAVSESTSYYRGSSPYLDDVYFVPASGWTGTTDIRFTGYSTGGQRFTGSVRITVRGSGTSGTLSYSTSQGSAVNFSAEDFDSACRDLTERHLNYVRFDLPSASVGTLRYNYNSSSSIGSAVSSGSSYYRSSSPYLSNVSFVPASGFSGTADIRYTGYDTSGQSYTGTVSVTVKGTAAAGIIYQTVTAGKSLSFDNAMFQNACSARGAASFASLTFSSLPSASVGQLRYQYVSSSTPGTAVTANTTYYVSAAPLVSNLCFVAAPDQTGTVTLSYTGKDSSGVTYPGTIVLTIVSSGTSASSFTDMGNYAWASKSVEYLYVNGVVNGTGGGKFSPGSPITRGSFMLMLNRAFKFTASGGAGFSDVPDGSVYADAVKIAQALGIAQGSGGRFYPTQPLSRQQAAVFLARAMRADGWTISGGTRSELSSFSDAASVSDYAVSDLAAMVRMGIFQGGSDGRLNPQAPLTRAQMAVILCRAITQ